MATAQVVDGLLRAFPAGASLVGKLNLIAKFTGTGENIDFATAASDKLVGVIIEEAAIGKPATVQFGGIGKCIAGGVVAAGDLITADSAGKGIATTSTGNRIIGSAATAASGDGIVFDVMLNPGSV